MIGEDDSLAGAHLPEFEMTAVQVSWSPAQGSEKKSSIVPGSRNEAVLLVAAPSAVSR
jgi:hypothetical protein